jgi:hypothetical protein
MKVLSCVVDWICKKEDEGRRKQIEIPMITFVYIQELESAILCYHGWCNRVVVASSRFTGKRIHD